MEPAFRGQKMKAGWRFAGMKRGAPFVTADGALLMLGLPAASWDSQHKVIMCMEMEEGGGEGWQSESSGT